MDIGLLKTFLEVNRTRHFGQAAENLFLTQSAISARIRLLEQTVGLQLFTRTRNNIELTPAGQKLLKHADTIINTWNRARQEIAIEDTSKTPFAVGGVPSLWDILLQDWLNNLLQNDDKLVIHAEVHGAETLVRRLIDGILDVAFMFESLQMSELLVDEVEEINLVMVSSKPDLSAQEAVNTDYILVDWGTSFSVAHAQHFPDIPSPRLHAHIGRLAYNYMLKCGGTAYLAESMIKKELETKSLFIVSDAPVIKRMAYAAYLPNSERLDTIKQAICSLPQSGEPSG